MEHIPAIISAACLMAEAGGTGLEDVLREMDGEGEDIALVKLAHRFIMKAQKEWGSDDFDRIIKMECDAIRNGAQ